MHDKSDGRLTGVQPQMQTTSPTVSACLQDVGSSSMHDFLMDLAAESLPRSLYRAPVQLQGGTINWCRGFCQCSEP